MDIKNTLEVLELARVAGVTVTDVLTDGKFTVTDLPKLAKLWAPAKDALEGVNLVADEIKDLSLDEVTQVLNAAVAVAVAWMNVLTKPA